MSEKRTEKHTETHACDSIDRQAAIDAIDVLKRNYPSSCFEELCKAVDIAIKALSAHSDPHREDRSDQITVCPMCPDCPDNCPLGEEKETQPDYDLSGYSDKLWKAAYERGKAQSERKRGKWLEVEVFPVAYDIEGVKTWASELQCEQCGFRHTAIEGHMAQYNFCPNCGAKMEDE